MVYWFAGRVQGHLHLLPGANLLHLSRRWRSYEGIVRYGTDAEIQKNHIDTHDQSEGTFALFFLAYQIHTRCESAFQFRLSWFLRRCGQRITYCHKW